MKPTESKKPEATTKPTPLAREERKPDAKEPETLNYAELDLTIEKVDERIAPSETNVFDK